MAKLQLPMVGAQISTKEMLILIGLIGLTAWMIKRNISKTVTMVTDTVKPVFTKPGEMIHDFFNEDPERDIYDIRVSDLLAVNRQILDAQEGVYTHRADTLH